MIEVKAPHDYSAHKQGRFSVFLAGSIEMGKAERWQDEIVRRMEGHDILILNPRRSEWNSSWEQKTGNISFREQVEWELDALEAVDIIVFYFDPTTKSPITLLELGLHAGRTPEKLVVCCADGFWRKGNVDITCEKYGVKQVDTLDDVIATILATGLKQAA